MGNEHRSRWTFYLVQRAAQWGQTHHDDLLDGADDVVHERLEFNVVVKVVGVADAH